MNHDRRLMCGTYGGVWVMANKAYNVLFLCTGNSARSLMAEAIIEREAPGLFRGFSAGSKPAEAPHPYTIDLLKRLNHNTEQMRSKDWSEFAETGAPEMDFVFTVCDQAAAETCPIWPGQPMSAHWGIPNPVEASGTESEQRLAFSEAYRMLRNRIMIFVSLPIDTLEGFALQERLDEIGKMADRTSETSE